MPPNFQHVERNLLARALAGLTFIAVLPLLAVCAAAIFLEDRGPVLFRQRRIGKNGKPFLLLKLRSMQPSPNGGSITGRGDSRITAIGRWLRENKIDELPQLWNIFRGEMTFLGPRPEVSEFVDLSDPRWRAVLSVTPGFADLATLVFLHEEHLISQYDDVERFYREWLLPRKLDLSAHYMRTRSWATDARLIALTLKHLIDRREFDRHELARRFAYEGILCPK